MFLNICMRYIDVTNPAQNISQCILGILGTCGYAQNVELLFKWHILKSVTSTSLLQLDVTHVWGQDNTGVEILRHQMDFSIHRVY